MISRQTIVIEPTGLHVHILMNGPIFAVLVHRKLLVSFVEQVSSLTIHHDCVAVDKEKYADWGANSQHYGMVLSFLTQNFQEDIDVIHCHEDGHRCQNFDCLR